MKQYNILCATDNNFVPYCGIMLTSLFESNKDIVLNVYILTDKLFKENKEKLIKLANKYQQRIEVITINQSLLKNCPIREGDHISLATYYRILAPMLLPGSIDTILYLDCDIVVTDSIRVLYDIDMSDYAIGGVLDEDCLNEKKYLRLNIPYNKSYINAGILLINIDYWRKRNFVEECFSYIKENREKIQQHDQDVLNAVFYNKKKILPLKYNIQTGFILTNIPEELKQETSKNIQDILNPVIIHYTGPHKPWHKGNKHPYRKRFLYYKSISLWNNIPLIEKRSFKDLIRSYIHEVIWRMGIKKRPKTYTIEEQK